MKIKSCLMLVLALTFSFNLFSQTENKTAAVSLIDFPENTFTNSDINMSNVRSMSTEHLKPLIEVSARQADAFKKDFNNAVDASWFNCGNREKELIVKFYNDRYECRAVYNSKGRLVCSVLQFGINNLPARINKIIKSNYRKHVIKNIMQVKNYDEDTWMLKLASEDELVAVQIQDDALEEIAANRLPKAHLAANNNDKKQPKHLAKRN